MMKLSTVSLLAASLALPVMAQTSTSPSNTAGVGTTAPAARDTAGSPAGQASARNPILTDSGGMRASKIVGSSVYNDKDEKVGSIDDIVIGNDKTLHAVISVGGILGVGARMVEVPFDKLQFGNVTGSSDNRIVMPGVTKDVLNAMPEYHYTTQG
jgi:sporulation protein YlmC with PRC-barrel domain